MKAHSLEGARIAAKFGRIRESVPIIRHHHERWDGRGYPDGLAGEDIPRGRRDRRPRRRLGRDDHRPALQRRDDRGCRHR